MANLPDKFKGMSDEQLLELHKNATASRNQSRQPRQGTFVTGLLDKIDPSGRLTNSLRGAAQGFTGQKIGGLQTSGNELQTYLAKKNIDKSFQPQTAPEGYILSGGKLLPDPNFIDPIEKSRIDYNNQRTGQGGLGPARQAKKEQRTERLLSTFEENKAKRKLIEDAEKSLQNVPTGRMGNIESWWLRNFDSENPKLKDWQKVKMVLTDASLMNTAKTKGAISDFEMSEIMKAAANDDLMSIQRAKPVIDKLTSFLDADESAQVGTFKRIYNEDPTQWPEMEEFNKPMNTKQSSEEGIEMIDANGNRALVNPQTGEVIREL